MIARILEWLAGLFEHEVDASTFCAYIQSEYGRLTDKNNLEPAVEIDLSKLEKTLADLGWVKTSKLFQEEQRKSNYPAGIEWFERQTAMPGAGQALDQLDSQGGDGDVKAILEKLLRHVEVKRENSLSKFTGYLSDTDIWLERCDISILFSRTARRHHDLRFLNAALKMNEWYFRKISSTTSLEIKVRFLRALAEQELSAGELLAC